MERTLLNFTDIVFMSGVSFNNDCHTFEFILNTGMCRNFSHASFQQACEARNEIIERMLHYWGVEQMLIPNGMENEIAIQNAMVDITDIYIKDSFAAFTVLVGHESMPMHFVFRDIDVAESYHMNLKRSLESIRRDRAVYLDMILERRVSK